MAEKKSYLVYPYNDTVVNDIVKGIDQDLEKSEKILMFGLSFGMFSSLLAPMAPPTVLLPLVALNFIITSSWAHINYHRMEIIKHHNLKMKCHTLITKTMLNFPSITYSTKY